MTLKTTLEIVRLGHPALRAISEPVTKDELRSRKFQKFLKQLLKTCKQGDGVGIAAPQVGVTKRVIVVNIHETSRYPDSDDTPQYRDIIVINPKCHSCSVERTEDWEGDLSSNLYGLVPRSVRCTVTGLNPDGEEVTYKLEGFPARVFQHEIDHLDGLFLIDRVERKETIAEREMWEKFHLK